MLVHISAFMGTVNPDTYFHILMLLLHIILFWLRLNWSLF